MGRIIIDKKIIEIYWIYLTFGFFFIQNLILFITVFLWSYPSGFITIATNNYGEMIFEIILSGIITVFSLIGLFKIKKWLVNYS